MVPQFARLLFLVGGLLGWGCGGSGLSGESLDDSSSPFTLGTVGADVAETRSQSPEESDTGSRSPDVVAPGPTAPDVVEVPPPDGFPSQDTGACPEGAPCPLNLTDPCYMGQCNALGSCIALPIPGCCESDDDCVGLIPTDACDLHRCVDNICQAVTRPGCCSTPATCDDGEACTTDTCLDGPGGQCTNCPVTCDCPDASSLLEAHFDEPSLSSEGFGYNDQQSDSVSWRLSTRRAVSPPSSVWIGDINCPTYYSGTLGTDCQPTSSQGVDAGTVSTTLVGPATPLPTSPGGHVASFWIWSEVEPLQTGSASERDVLTLLVHDIGTGESWPIASSLWVGKSTQGGWRQMAVDLSPWTGATISLRFLFDTLDGQDNHHEGVYLDDVVIGPRCASGCCVVDADCAGPGEPDTCLEHRCLGLADGAGATCLSAPIDPGAPCTACASDQACDDDNPCTDDVCGANGTCTHTSFCCFEVSTYATSFEIGLVGWYAADDQPDDGATWAATQLRASDGASSAWTGDPLTGTYATGGRVSTSLRSPQAVLPSNDDDEGMTAVRFALFLSTEWDGQVYDNPAGLDRLSLEVQASGGGVLEVWSSDAIGGTTEGAWIDVEVSLAAWAGQPVQLRFVFDTVDEAANDFAGPHIDDVRIGHVCP